MLNIPKKEGQRNRIAVGEPLSYGVNGAFAPHGFVVWMMLRLEDSDAKLASLHVHAWRYVLEDRSEPPSYKRVVVGGAYRRESVPPPEPRRAQVRRNITIAQRREAVRADGWKRTGSFFFKCGVGYAPLFAQEELQEIWVQTDPGGWQQWSSAISEQPKNCPPSGVITVEPPILLWAREIVNIDLQ